MIVHEGGSAQAKVLAGVARAVIRPALALYPARGPLSAGRHAIELVAHVQPRSRKVRVRQVKHGHWDGELVRPRGTKRGTAAIVYFHGGGFLFCGTATHRKVVEQLSLRTGVPVLSVNYRQHGRGTVRESVADGLDAVLWMLAQGYDPQRLVLAGDSAGGHIAFAVAMALRDRGIALAGLVGLSPWLDFDNTVRIAAPYAVRESYLPAKRLDRIAQLVTGQPIIEPSLSPVNGKLRGLPPTLLICSTDEILRHDSEIAAKRLRAAGVPVALHGWEGQVHAFPVLAGLVPESDEALGLACEFIREHVGVAEGGRHLRAVGDVAS
ncbi:alpha/beta hydrolase [Nocardioides alcanivorans]|uniref:alpha/beta hydrolase n=1 Tax=Nocardioides alcanivorans TaxID=2897352 RepID=UPI001F2020AC|nr:alpha/beta hydrolase [Nocardioides alcanivorans]